MSDVHVGVTPARQPLAWQAASAIRSGIHEGRWRVGQRLPSEPELASQLGVSRATLRESFRLLISDGLLRRQHGVGTFIVRVPKPTIERGIDELFGLADVIEQLGYSPSEGECSMDVEAAAPYVAGELRLAESAEVCHLRRIRLADSRPVIVCDDYFALTLLADRGIDPTSTAREIRARGSLYTWMEERVGATIDTALTHIEPLAADGDTAEALQVPIGAALLRLRQTHYTPEGLPVLYSENVHNSDVIKFHVMRHRARDPATRGREVGGIAR